MAKKMAKTGKTEHARAKFMMILRRTANVSLACRALGINRATAYFKRDPDHPSYDAEFAAEWDNALEEAFDHLEGEAFRRAFKGCRKPVYQSGALVGYVKEYSDQLMQLLLRGRKPIYREKVLNEHVGKDGKSLAMEIVFVSPQGEPDANKPTE